MNYLIIDKDAIIHHFNIHSQKWENSDNITLKIHLLEKDIDEILPFLLEYSNNLAYSIMNEICQMNNLEEKHLKILYDKGDTACKVSICLRKNLPNSIVCRCKESLIEEVKHHYLLISLDSWDEWKYFNTNGELLRIEVYENGELIKNSK